MPSAPVFTKYPAHVIDRRSALTLSGWWRRVFASLIDSVIVIAIFMGIVLSGAGAARGSYVVIVIAIAAIPLYHVLGHGGRQGQTVGKKMLGIAVRHHSGGRIGYLRALVRFLAMYMLNALPFVGMIDGLRPLWNDMNRSYHDGIANTIVVRVR